MYSPYLLSQNLGIFILATLSNTFSCANIYQLNDSYTISTVTRTKLYIHFKEYQFLQKQIRKKNRKKVKKYGLVLTKWHQSRSLLARNELSNTDVKKRPKSKGTYYGI